MDIPKYKDVAVAHERIREHVKRTPVLTSESINRELKCELFFKCENFQKIGAFKFRGACNAVFGRRFKELLKGVAAHSSGNHAAALALAAKIRGIPSYIVVPTTIPDVKLDSVLRYGGKVFKCLPTLESREAELKKVIEETGATEIHPYNNFYVIAGQGTCAKELSEDVSVLDALIAPVGGGGLLSGTCISAHALNPSLEIYAGEPAGACDAFESLKAGKLIPVKNPETIADGLMTSLSPLTFEIIKSHVSDIFPVSEQSIVRAMKLCWERLKIVIEPSAAVPLAAVIDNQQVFRGKKTGVILSGGNISPEKACKLFSKAGGSL